jgi:hypothetical protein
MCRTARQKRGSILIFVLCCTTHLIHAILCI